MKSTVVMGLGVIVLTLLVSVTLKRASTIDAPSARIGVGGKLDQATSEPEANAHARPARGLEAVRHAPVEGSEGSPVTRLSSEGEAADRANSE